ncbi:MAG: PQQ-binding-like beta-propeller repeat protein, partial [bacterium]|nr:PQQ-binding-like beta-propeller repeat protein [bacterium]
MRPTHLIIALAVACSAYSQVQGEADRGEALYGEHCVVCHGAAADGGSAPDLTNARWHSGISDAALDAIIRDGISGRSMPSFRDKLDEEARGSIIAHLRALSKNVIQPTTDLQAPPVTVSPERLHQAGEDPDYWLMYGRDYTNQRFSPLDEINTENVQRLVPVWSFQTGVPDGLHASPLVIDGVIYLTTAWNHVFAIDARTGGELWHYQRRLPEELKYCCGPVNWGVAIREDTLYLGTLDAHLVALDARSGRVKWDVEVGSPSDNLSIKSVPLIVKDKVLVGVAGGDFPSRGFIDGYDARSGLRVWRFYTIPGDGEPGVETWSGDSHKTGGGAAWGIGSYD